MIFKAFCVTAAVLSASPPAIADPKNATASCDGRGVWKVAIDWGAGTCPPLRREQRDFLVSGQRGKLQIAGGAATPSHQIQLTLKRPPASPCSLRVLESRRIAIATVDDGQDEDALLAPARLYNVRYDYTLVDRGGLVTGEGIYTDVGDEMISEGPRCAQKFTLIGTHRPETPKDTALDVHAIKKEFGAFIVMTSERCHLPFFRARVASRRVFAVELTIAVRGGPERLKLDGEDQDMRGNCTDVITENRMGFFANPTGKQQVFQFVGYYPP